MYVRQERINCPRCQDTKERLYIKRVKGGWIRHCHNENCFAKDSFLPEKEQTPKDIIEQAKTLLYTTQDSIEYQYNGLKLPYDFTTNIVSAGRRWLDKYEITDEEIRKFGIGYSERLNRVILPVYKGEELLYWQGRNIGTITKENPKYLNIRNQGAKSVFFRRSGRQASHMVDTLCITEDILSTIKVGRVCNSLALLGSYFPKEFYQEIKDYQKLYIWLDEDKYFTALKEAKKIATYYPISVIVIKTTKDPKEYNGEEICHILKLT